MKVVKVVVATFNQEKTLVGVFFVIVKLQTSQRSVSSSTSLPPPRHPFSGVSHLAGGARPGSRLLVTPARHKLDTERFQHKAESYRHPAPVGGMVRWSHSLFEECRSAANKR